MELGSVYPPHCKPYGLHVAGTGTDDAHGGAQDNMPRTTAGTCPACAGRIPRSSGGSQRLNPEGQTHGRREAGSHG